MQNYYVTGQYSMGVFVFKQETDPYTQLPADDFFHPEGRVNSFEETLKSYILFH